MYKMTIAICTSNYASEVGGIATFNQHLSFILSRAGHHVIVLYPDHKSSEEEDSVIVKGLITEVCLKRSYTFLKKEWQSYFTPGGFDAPGWIALGLAMRQWLLENQLSRKIDVLEVSDYGGIGIFLCHKDLPPVVVTGHGSLLQYSRYNYARKDDHYKTITRLEELSFQKADAIIAHSPLNEADLEQLFGREIDFTDMPWEDNSSSIQEDGIIGEMVVVGGMQPIKGVYVMAEAMCLLKQAAPSIRVRWIGGDTWLAPGQEQMSTYLNNKYPQCWQSNLHWTGALNPMATKQAIARASLVIIPSVFETYNYVALEAAAMGKAIIISEGAGASWLFTHEQDAWIIPADDHQKLAEAIVLLSEQPVLCRKIGANAKAMLKDMFDEQSSVEDRIMIYKKAIRFVKVKGYAFQELEAYL
jgi:glycosyltransferase involved in cell wall biosynthesis